MFDINVYNQNSFSSTLSKYLKQHRHLISALSEKKFFVL